MRARTKSLAPNLHDRRKKRKPPRGPGPKGVQGEGAQRGESWVVGGSSCRWHCCAWQPSADVSGVPSAALPRRPAARRLLVSERRRRRYRRLVRDPLDATRSSVCSGTSLSDAPFIVLEFFRRCFTLFEDFVRTTDFLIHRFIVSAVDWGWIYIFSCMYDTFLKNTWSFDYPYYFSHYDRSSNNELFFFNCL